ncbi:hypothetical protein [Staphylococcus aureus]|uniref:hypothetical protein n=1 Tax=Staphylococcus aureus TaxID=1280 RepID=UPI001243E715|nr:hypothetical protein [Staphylococcus aureus]
MENNIALKTKNPENTYTNSEFDVNQYYDSVKELKQLIDVFSNELDSLNNTFIELKEGNLSNELTAVRRDELLNHLLSEKESFNNLYNGFIDALTNDISKVDKIRINSSVNTNIFKDYLEEQRDDSPINTSQLFHKMHK